MNSAETHPPDADVQMMLLLSAQRALLGAVSPALRGVTVGARDKVVLFRCYLDGPIAEEDREALQVAGTEIIADFPAPWDINEEIIRCDAPAEIEVLDAWVYRRRE